MLEISSTNVGILIADATRRLDVQSQVIQGGFEAWWRNELRSFFHRSYDRPIGRDGDVVNGVVTEFSLTNNDGSPNRIDLALRMNARTKRSHLIELKTLNGSAANPSIDGIVKDIKGLFEVDYRRLESAWMAVLAHGFTDGRSATRLIRRIEDAVSDEGYILSHDHVRDPLGNGRNNPGNIIYVLAFRVQ
jgi:hypothetical protein